MMGPMVMAFMAILTPLWETTQKIIIQLLAYVSLLANGMISWSSCKQKTIAQSTSEAEYMALANAANQAVWYHGFLKELLQQTNNGQTGD